MRVYILTITLLVVFGLISQSISEGVNEDDGFRRLLRRASAEADRPLIREQRRNRDEDDEDFGDIIEHQPSNEDVIRKRRDEEDAFYHTLLARSESKRKEKRSFDTNDVDNKAGYIVKEDWTGDSKISDADRRELENLFQKLNSDDSLEKIETTRSTADDDDDTVESAAKDYTSWLMEQPVSKMSAALSHKADIDHRLTELFFKSKRDTLSKRHKSTKEDEPGNVKYPEPANWKKTAKKSSGIGNHTVTKGNGTAENCSTAECLCERTCSPKHVASATPCECQEMLSNAKGTGKSDAKNVITQGSKLCTDDTPKCLCTRACYPKSVTTYSPCNCEGEDSQRNETVATGNKMESLTNTTVNKTTSEPETVKAAPPAKKLNTPQNNPVPPQLPTLQNIPAFNTPQDQNSITQNIQKAQLCTDTSPKCKCKKHCHPYIVQRVTPCSCGKSAETPINTSMFVQQICGDRSAECTCKKACHPNPVISSKPCSCQSASNQTSVAQAITPSSAPVTNANNNTSNTPLQTPVNSYTNPIMNDEANEPAAPAAQQTFYYNSLQANQGNAPIISQGDQENAPIISQPVASFAAPLLSSALFLNNTPTTSTNNFAVPNLSNTSTGLNAENTTRGEQRSVDPIASGWCKQACHPLTVALEKPCRCASATSNFFPPRAPEAARQPQVVQSPAAQAPLVPVQTTLPAQAQLTQTQSSSFVEPSQQQVAVAPAVAAYNLQAGITPVQQAVDNPCSRSCHPKPVKDINPCSCHNTNATQSEAEGLFGTNQPIYTTHPSYQGCFRDKRPIRDLPKRFTRYQTTPEACIKECQYQNYKFAGVQYGYLCFCGNAFGRYGRAKDQDCNSLCNGDSKRRCGAFWHNSVYSVDGKEYDPSDFDFGKVDAEERLRDTLPPPPIRMVKKDNQNMKVVEAQGANVATHLMKAAQAALKAAQKLLPSVSKKHKLHKKGRKHGRKEKREDDEEDEELMQQKMASLASLSAAREILKKTDFGMDKRDAEREKRSIDEDSDPYDPDNGKDLLTAYLSNIDAYKRQVRSVDEDEEDDDVDEKPKFEYRRMVIGEGDDGEFVEKYADEATASQKKKRTQMEKRSSREDAETENIKRSSTLEGSGASEKIKRAAHVGSGGGERKKRAALEGSGASEKIKRAAHVGSGGDERKRRTALEGSGASEKIKRAAHVGSGGDERKKRATLEGSGAAGKIKRSAHVGSGSDERKKRSLHAGSGDLVKNFDRKKRRSAGSSSKVDISLRRNRRSATEASGVRSRRSITQSSGSSRRRRSIPSGSGGEMKVKREMLAADEIIPEEALEGDEDESEAAGENESGSGNLDEEEEGSGAESSGESDDQHDMNKRDSEDDMQLLFEKRSVSEENSTNSTKPENGTENGRLKSDVEKGVDSLLNLVVELYKQQKTIKAFESSVRSLRHDILRELNVPNDKKTGATKKVRDAIEKTARDRLHILTSSIEHKITEFAKAHPEASKQANLASSLLPKLPLNAQKLTEMKKEISRRSAEFDNIEDAFMENEETDIPEILKEHFRRNAERDDYAKTKRELSNGEVTLSRMHRDIQEEEMETDDVSDIDAEFAKFFN